MIVRYHVTSTRNRASIARHGLDWQRMGPALGIAGSLRPEQPGCFLCGSEWERDWFVRMNNTGGPVDVWEVHGVRAEDLIESPEGHHYLPGVIPLNQLRLALQDIPPLAR